MITRTTSVSYAGAVGAVTILKDGSGAKYVALYSQSGTCSVSLINDIDYHGDVTVDIAEGRMWELDGAVSQINYSGNGSTLVLIQDINSNVIQTYGQVPMTYDGEELYYNVNKNNSELYT